MNIDSGGRQSPMEARLKPMCTIAPHGLPMGYRLHSEILLLVAFHDLRAWLARSKYWGDKAGVETRAFRTLSCACSYCRKKDRRAEIRKAHVSTTMRCVFIQGA